MYRWVNPSYSLSTVRIVFNNYMLLNGNLRQIMSKSKRVLNRYQEEAIKALLEDCVTVKIVNISNRASLSILELLEFGLSLKEINHALANGIIEFDKTLDLYRGAGGDYYFKFLNSKIKLTELGLYLFEYIQSKRQYRGHM